MKIEIEVSDLSEFISALNNAMIAYGDICTCIILGCEPDIRTANKVAFENIGEEKLETRYKHLMNVYLQLIDLEEKVKE